MKNLNPVFCLGLLILLFNCITSCEKEELVNPKETSKEYFTELKTNSITTKPSTNDSIRRRFRGPGSTSLPH
ncbi:hypothetical protein [Kordia jejudonensis]|uniref:hypothetical protein n=1 Tax=Kordia jejudonensis TaxID=1348245 RepID=UPI0006290371|nr:hypothetical protein [Kordia jejudonensis]